MRKLNKELFGECSCPCSGFGRVCLKGDEGLPDRIVSLAKEFDKEHYSPSCFCIDVFSRGATINYISKHRRFSLACICDICEEALQYYKENANDRDLRETFMKW